MLQKTTVYKVDKTITFYDGYSSLMDRITTAISTFLDDMHQLWLFIMYLHY